MSRFVLQLELKVRASQEDIEARLQMVADPEGFLSTYHTANVELNGPSAAGKHTLAARPPPRGVGDDEGAQTAKDLVQLAGTVENLALRVGEIEAAMHENVTQMR